MVVSKQKTAILRRGVRIFSFCEEERYLYCLYKNTAFETTSNQIAQLVTFIKPVAIKTSA